MHYAQITKLKQKYIYKNNKKYIYIKNKKIYIYAKKYLIKTNLILFKWL